GLVLDPVTCTISGTPSGVDADFVEYGIVAMSAVAESSPARIKIEVQQGPPSLSYVGATGTEASVGVETTITPTIFNANGNSVTLCEASPPLPNGLIIDPETCVISGIMKAPQPITTYTITVTSDYNPPGFPNDPADSQSTAEVSIVGVSCPPGYVKVASSTYYGTGDFCVMEYEARCKGKFCVPNLTTVVIPDPEFAVADVSNTAELPWVNITIDDAQRACEFNGYKYDLISNREWMAMAAAIVNRPENWSGFAVNNGCVKQGNSKASNPACGYKSGDPMDVSNNLGIVESQSNITYSRHTIADNGDGVIDVSGNVSEWVDWSLSTGVQLGPNSCDTLNDDDIPYNRFGNDVFCNIGDTPSSLDVDPDVSNPNDTMGLGMFYGIQNNDSGAAARGGNHQSEDLAGIYGLELDRTRLTRDARTGFRCVWRPATPPRRPNVTFNPTSRIGKVGVEFIYNPSYLEVNDERLLNCTITPALPSGLFFDPTVCEVYGTPTVASSNTKYTVTPVNSVGNDSSPAEIFIRIDP
ncbi:MAG: Ig domain-containing protein, partial [Bacteriovoracia bacterium]